MKNTKVWLIVSLILLAVLVVPLGISGCGASPAAAKEVALLTNEPPSTFATLTTNWLKILAQQSKIKAVARTVPSVNSRFALLRAGEDVAMVMNGLLAGPTIYGIDIFAAPEWGPQRVRAIWVSTMWEPIGMFVNADSGITDIAQLKGKRIAFHEGSAGRQTITEAMLAFGNITWNDVTKVPAPGYNEAIQLMMDGKLDSTYGSLGSAKWKEAEASPHGLRVLALPASNKKGWDAIYATYQGQAPGIVEKGQGPGDQSVYPLESSGHMNYGLVGPNLDDEIAYELAKAVTLNGATMVEGLPLFKPADLGLDVVASKRIMDYIPIPYHPGFIKFLKDEKVWNDEYEAWQQKRLAEEEARIAKWKAGLK